MRKLKFLMVGAIFCLPIILCENTSAVSAEMQALENDLVENELIIAKNSR
ncbi:hypothetical protein IJM16_03230 [Candidatus Saccharibacteria bacterium]|nr:hypothetical protein [Candidatus Saccharibacteria bacterium]